MPKVPQSKQNVDEQFLIILSHGDYQKYLNDKQKYKNCQKLFKQITQINEQLESELKLVKKQFLIKKAQVQFISLMINKFINSIDEQKNKKLNDQNAELQESQFERLIAKNSTKDRLSSIEMYQITETFQNKYMEIKFEFDKISGLFECSNKITNNFKRKFLSAENSKKKIIPGHEQEDEPQIQQLKPVEQQIEDYQSAIKTLLNGKNLLKKQNQLLKQRVSQYQFKMFDNPEKKSQDKSYFIKLLIDESKRDLLKKLKLLKLPQEEIQAIINTELTGIKQYTEKLMMGGRMTTLWAKQKNNSI